MAENNGSESSNGKNIGRVESVTGVVVDAVFADDLPEIYSALEIEMTAGGAERDADEASTWSARSSSTSATTACAPSRWTRPTASSAATR